MSTWRTLSITIIITLILTTATAHIANAEQPQDKLIERSMKILGQLQYLESKDMNVTPLVHTLNKAIQLAEKGEYNKASKLLDTVEANTSKLIPLAEHHYHLVIARKAIAVAGILSIPILFYYGFPRLYLYIWFRLRRRWIVKNGST